MKNQTFHWELRTILTQFEDAFNDIVINRYNIDKEAKDQIQVNFRYSPKNRVLHDLVQKNQHLKLPIVCISNGGLKRAPERVFTKHDGSYWTDTTTPSNSSWIHLLQPVPVDLTVNMSIIARFQQDVDQIISNFIPYCDPYVVVSWKWPDLIPFGEFEIRSHVKWNENINFQYPLDIGANQSYRIIADTSFTIESWMFKNSPGPGKPIYVVDTTFATVSDFDAYADMKARESEYNADHTTDYTVISARPQFFLCEPFAIYENAPSSLRLLGNMLDYTEAVYISSSDWTMFDTTSSSTLSSGVTYQPVLTTTTTTYPGFSGIYIEKSAWIAQEHRIDISLTPQSSGRFDIIATNHAGYGLLTEDTIRPTTNPYPSGTDAYDNYIEYQYPCVSGVEVLTI